MTSSENRDVEPQRPRWRFSISTLMLLVVTVGLGTALVVERRNHERELERLKAELADARRRAMEYHKALEASYQVLARIKAGATSQGPSGGAKAVHE
jgi:hypothetical protein